MDPLTGAVVALVLFAVSVPVSFTLLPFGLAMVGEAIEFGGSVVGVFVGYVLAAGWAVFAIIQCILQIVRIIQVTA